MALEKYEDKDAFMEELGKMRPDLLFPEDWGKDKIAKAAEMIRPAKTKTAMLSNIPLRCRGPKCIYAEICPLLAENLAPEGLPCPIESAHVKQLFEEYVDELAIDTSRIVEVSIVRDLVDQEIQQMRATKTLSTEHFIQENPVGVDADGEVILRKELHQAVDYQDRIYRRKEKIRNALVATREKQAQIGMGQLDNARALANLVDQHREITNERDRLLRKKLGLENYDEYIEQDKEIIDAEVVEPEDG